MSRRRSLSLLAAVSLCAAAAACSNGVELQVGLQAGPATDSFALVNRSPEAWSEVRVRVTGDSGSAACFDQVLPSWGPGEARSFPRCGDRTLVAVDVGGRGTELVYANGMLCRKLGRREVPVPR